MPLGSSTDLGLTVTNTGAAVYEFEIGERDRGREILAQRGCRRSAGYPARSRRCRRPAGPEAARAPVAAPERSVQEPPWTDIADYPTAIMDSTADAFDGLVYSVGGFDGGINVADAYVYDPDHRLVEPDRLDGLRPGEAGGGLHRRPALRGRRWDNSGDTVPALEIYDPATDTWSTGADVPNRIRGGVGRGARRSALRDRRMSRTSCGSTDVFVYDPAGDTWSTGGAVPGADLVGPLRRDRRFDLLRRRCQRRGR